MKFLILMFPLMVFAQEYDLDVGSGTVDCTEADFTAGGTYECADVTIGGAGVNLAGAGGAALVIKATGSVTISAPIVLNGSIGGAGTQSGGSANSAGGIGGPGGTSGGNCQLLAAGDCDNPGGALAGADGSGTDGGGGGTSRTGGLQYGDGGGGAGNGAVGVQGNDPAAALNGGSAGTASTDVSNFEASFNGGYGGGAGGAGNNLGTLETGAGGGGGGGALRIVAANSITINANITAAGGAGGNSGAGGTGGGGAGGGGSGGSIWLQSLSVSNNAIIDTEGGAGGTGHGGGASDGGTGGNGVIRIDSQSGVLDGTGSQTNTTLVVNALSALPAPQIDGDISCSGGFRMADMMVFLVSALVMILGAKALKLARLVGAYAAKKSIETT